MLSLAVAYPLYAAEPLLGPGAESTAEMAAPATAAEPAAMEPTAAAPTGGQIARAAFTRAIQEREPTDQIATLGNDQTQIFYFTELKGMSGQTVTHRWEYNGKVMAEVPFQVSGPRWRTFSSKTLDPLWLGEWKVSVVDAAGSTLSVNTFTYTQTVAKPEAAPAATPAIPAPQP